jgi:PIN domain
MSAMPTNYVLVDFENVQPDLSLLANTAHKVKVFFGAKQQEGRVPFKLLDAMLALGGNVEPIKVTRSGSNAVDMHIAYYIGRLIEREPDAALYIISGDTDFDPLVEFLRAGGVSCKRAKTIAEILKKGEAAKPAPGAVQAPAKSRVRPASASKVSKQPKPAVSAPRDTVTDKLAPLVKHLQSLKDRPSTRQKLGKFIATHLRQHGGPQPDSEIEKLIQELFVRKLISENDRKFVYQLG